MPAHLITQAELKELLHYDPETGVFTWISKSASNTRLGSRAGWVRRDGYRGIEVKYREYLAHRLAWLFMTGEHSVCHIDHINRIRDDNSWANLRLAVNGQADNMQNTGLLSKSASGLKGVYKVSTPQRQKNPYNAAICVKGKLMHIGCFATPEEASAAYLAKKRELHPFFVE